MSARLNTSDSSSLPFAWQDGCLRLLRDGVLRRSAHELRQALQALTHFSPAHQRVPEQQLRLRLRAVERELGRRNTHYRTHELDRNVPRRA